MQRTQINNALRTLTRAVPASRAMRAARQPYRIAKPWLLRSLGKTERISVPTVWGGTFNGLLPEAVSTVIWRNRYYESDASRALMRFLPEGGCFVDIGAHFGYFSLFASHLVGTEGRVLSIEAMPSTFVVLKENLEANAAHPNFTLHQGAAFNEDKTLQFQDYGLVSCSLNSAFGARGNTSASPGEIVEIEAQTADSIIQENEIQKVSVIKIDAESSEKFVLMGLTETINRDRPVIIMEVGDDGIKGGFSSSEHVDEIQKHGYVPHRWTDWDKLEPFTASGPLKYANLVFLKA